ncbi:hypothetical protein BC829DRAFT_489906 [Chytridium lagenaria]|nr:hypothetical protein BC829DRAFT_489906 [Chytridium lagenaria]
MRREGNVKCETFGRVIATNKTIRRLHLPEHILLPCLYIINDRSITPADIHYAVNIGNAAKVALNYRRRILRTRLAEAEVALASKTMRLADIWGNLKKQTTKQVDHPIIPKSESHPIDSGIPLYGCHGWVNTISSSHIFIYMQRSLKRPDSATCDILTDLSKIQPSLPAPQDPSSAATSHEAAIQILKKYINSRILLATDIKLRKAKEVLQASNQLLKVLKDDIALAHEISDKLAASESQPSSPLQTLPGPGVDCFLTAGDFFGVVVAGSTTTEGVGGTETTSSMNSTRLTVQTLISSTAISHRPVERHLPLRGGDRRLEIGRMSDPGSYWKRSGAEHKSVVSPRVIISDELKLFLGELGENNAWRDCGGLL